MTFSCRTSKTTSLGDVSSSQCYSGKSWSAIKAQVRKSWIKSAAFHGPGVTVAVELFQVDPITHTEKSIARLSGRHGDKPAWRAT